MDGCFFLVQRMECFHMMSLLAFLTDVVYQNRQFLSKHFSRKTGTTGLRSKASNAIRSLEES